MYTDVLIWHPDGGPGVTLISIEEKGYALALREERRIFLTGWIFLFRFGHKGLLRINKALRQYFPERCLMHSVLVSKLLWLKIVLRRWFLDSEAMFNFLTSPIPAGLNLCRISKFTTIFTDHIVVAYLFNDLAFFIMINSMQPQCGRHVGYLNDTGYKDVIRWD